MDESSSPDNETLVRGLRKAGTKEKVLAAFQSVDRGRFTKSSRPANRGIYADMPYRDDLVHLSAPSIYADSLEAMLPLSDDSSVLVIGSGSGYFCSLVSALAGNRCHIQGVELNKDLVTFSRSICPSSVSIIEGNAFLVDNYHSTRYDRVYVAGGANSKGHKFYRLLKLNGILVGPYFEDHDSQSLIKVIRESPTDFTIEKLKSVMFAHLTEPPVATRTTDQPITLKEPVWSPELYTRFPNTFKASTYTLLLCLSQYRIVNRPILMFLPRGWFKKELEFTEPKEIYEITKTLNPHPNLTIRPNPQTDVEMSGEQSDSNPTDPEPPDYSQNNETQHEHFTDAAEGPTDASRGDEEPQPQVTRPANHQSSLDSLSDSQHIEEDSFLHTRLEHTAERVSIEADRLRSSRIILNQLTSHNRQ